MAKKPLTFEERFEPREGVHLRPSLERLAYAILKDAQYLVDEAVLETVEKGWTKYSTFDEKRGTFQAWMYRILTNTCKSKLRKLTKVVWEPNEETGKPEKVRVRRSVEPKEGGDIEGVMDEARMEEWLDDDYTDAVHHLIDDYPENDPRTPSIEDYLKWKEELDTGEMSIYIEDEPTGCMMFYVRGDNYGLKRFTWDGPEPPDITMFKMIVEGTPRKTIAKKFPGKNIDTAIHRMKKKMMPA